MWITERGGLLLGMGLDYEEARCSIKNVNETMRAVWERERKRHFDL